MTTAVGRPARDAATSCMVAALSVRPVRASLGRLLPAAPLVLAIALMVWGSWVADWNGDGVVTASLLVLASASGFVLDDPAAVTVAASPTSLLRRRLLRIAMGAATTLAAWVLISVIRGAPAVGALGRSQLNFELLGASALSLAIAARAGGAMAATVTPLAAFFSTALSGHYSWLPSLIASAGGAGPWRWVLLVSALAIGWSSRDRAGRFG